jgi:hypothetical protein
MSARPLRLALVTGCLIMLLAPVAADAGDSGISFPPAPGDAWSGLLTYAGYYTTDSDGGDGSFNTNVTDVIGDTQILVDLTVGDDGAIMGTMTVDLTWFSENVGAAPVTFDPYRVVHDQHQTGTLRLSGTPSRIVATGTLLHETNTVADGDKVEEVSGVEDAPQTWEFRITQANCGLVTGVLTAVDGISIMATTLIPRATVSKGSSIYNQLFAGLVLAPKETAAADDLLEDVIALEKAADDLVGEEKPSARAMLDLVDQWTALRIKMAGYDECQIERAGWDPESERGWLVDALQAAVGKVLANVDQYTARELLDVWDAAVFEDALTPELQFAFIDPLNVLLDQAIADNDITTIIDIAVWASTYGFSVTHDKAQAALDAAT